MIHLSRTRERLSPAAMAKHSTDKGIKLTESEKRNFLRFGCALRERSGLLQIEWKGKSLDSASRAEVFARVSGIKSKAGPLVLLALEISLVRPLPQYCYFPFDLTQKAHRQYLANLTETGKIKLCFSDGHRTIEREHQLSPALREHAAETYAEAMGHLESYGTDKYEFESALQLMERWVRVPELLDHLLLAHDVSQIRAGIEEAVQLVPVERREGAHRAVREVVDAFKSEYKNNKKFLMENGQITRQGLLYLADLDRLSAEGAVDSAELIADGIAASFSEDDLANLAEWAKVVVALPKLGPLFKSDSGLVKFLHSAFLPLIPEGLGNAFELIAARRGISSNSLMTLAELLGLEVLGRGRPAKDYSREYERRISGNSWTEVARDAMTSRPDLRAESSTGLPIHC